MITGTWFTILNCPLEVQTEKFPTLESHALALNVHVPFAYSVVSTCLSHGVEVRLATSSQFVPSLEISISILEIVPLPVEEKLSVYKPLTSWFSLGPFANTNVNSLSVYFTTFESGKNTSPLCPIVMIITTNRTEMKRLINYLTTPSALECSHCNTPLRGVLRV